MAVILAYILMLFASYTHIHKKPRKTWNSFNMIRLKRIAIGMQSHLERLEQFHSCQSFYTFLFRVDNNNDLEGKEDTVK